MGDRIAALVDSYTVAFRTYLSDPAEFALVRAYEIGRAAMTEGLGVLQMGTLHSIALARVLQDPVSGGDHARLLEASERFFVEALSPFEMAHRGFREANAVLRRLNDTLEAQTRRIASTLHDEAAQLLVPVHLGLADVARAAPAAASEVHAVRGLLEAVEQRLRGLSHELRPPVLDDFGLVPALEFLTTSVSKRWGIAVTLETAPDPSLPAVVETTLYRITQEALANVAKHARASAAWVSLRRTARGVVCSIRDNGVGFGAEADGAGRGLGLAEIRERVTALGGLLRLQPNAGGGANVTVEIPLG